MNHKRHRPKNRRAGCLMCKPFKQNHLKGNRRRSTKSAAVTVAERRANISAQEQGA